MFVDGVDLYELLGLDGSKWVRPPRRVVCPPSDHLFGGPDRWEDPEDPWFDNGQVAIAACGRVAPQARLMPLRKVSGLGSQDEADCFVWAADKGADVISCSWLTIRRGLVGPQRPDP